MMMAIISSKNACFSAAILLLVVSNTTSGLIRGGGSGALKIQLPAEELPNELNHPRYITELEGAYLSLNVAALEDLYEPDNLESNIELINGWLKSERKTPTLLRVNKMAQAAIDLFLALAEIYQRCDYESYKILAQNYRAVDGRSHELTQNRQPIERMIYDYALEHHRECKPKYVALFREICSRPSAKVEAPIVDEVLKGLDADNLLAGENGAVAFKYKPENLIERPIDGFDLTNYGFHTIVKNIENLIRGKSEEAYFYPRRMAKEKSALSLPNEFKDQIFNKYLISPCQGYTELFRDVFAPARFDAMIMDDAGDGDESSSSNGNGKPLFPTGDGQFDTAFIQYRVCKHLIGVDRNDLFSIIEQVAKSFERD